MSRLTRKELKSDKFALEIGHTFTFFEEHPKEVARYGGVALAVIVLILGYGMYSRREHAARESALSAAIKVQEAPVGQSGSGGLAFATQAIKDEDSLKVFNDVHNKYGGTAEGQIAAYYLGAIKADQGKLDEAEKMFLEVSQKGDEKYAALSTLSLAQIYFAQGRADLGEKTLRELIAKPSVYVSSAQASVSLARYIAQKKPGEARRLLDPYRTQPGPVGQIAISLIGELPQ